MLSLLFGQAIAAPGPVLTVTSGVPLFSTGKDVLGTGTADENTEFKADIVTEGSLEAGLINCVRSDNVPVATQAIVSLGLVDGSAWEVTNESVTSTADASRAFYQQSQAQVGLNARMPTVAETSTILDSFCDFAPGDGNSCGQGFTALSTAVALYECCVTGAIAATEASAQTCPTVIDPQGTTSGGGTAGDTVTIDNTPLANRLLLETSTSNDPLGLGAITVTYDNDFLLASLAQQSLQSESTTWCNQEFFTDLATSTSGAVYGTNVGFNYKTKCTFQVRAAADKAPQFEVTTATTSAFLLQWIEWADADGLADANVLAAANLIANTDSYAIGAYAEADIVYFNPFATGYDPSGALALDQPAAGAEAFLSYMPTDFVAGSVGNINVYQNLANSAIQEEEFASVQSSVITMFFEDLAPIYAAYDSALGTYNSDADSYNSSVDAYNTALENGDKELPAIDEEPCAPSAPSAWAGFAMDFSNSWATSDLDHLGTAVGVYDILNTDVLTTPMQDSQKRGYIYAQPDTGTSNANVADAYDVANQAGHIFGRLGQGAKSMPDAMAPFRFDDDTASLATIQVSIFPEEGHTFNGGVLSTGMFVGVPFASGQEITLSITQADIDNTDGLTAPTIGTTSATTLTEVDGAKALILSAVAAAAAVASLV